MLQNNNPPYTFNPPLSRPNSLVISSGTPVTTQQSLTPSFLFQGLTPTNDQIVITPNTMKSIEQSILQTLGEDAEPYNAVEATQYSGNFVPPLPSTSIININTWQGGNVITEPTETDQEVPPPELPPPVTENQKKSPSKRQRKSPPQQQPKKPSPSKSTKSKSSSPGVTEEDERRKIRRERNKLAAARCRKRRVDHTNKLLNETEGLEAKKRSLQTQITELQSQKEELEFILEAHPCVRKKDVLTDIQNHPVRETGGKLKRPTSLPVNEFIRTSSSINTPVPPMPINTPSNGIELGFEPLDWDVNTPGHDRIEEKIVPENKGTSLVTPVNPFKKITSL